MITAPPDDRRGPRYGTPPEDRPPLSPQLALRAAIIGSVALGIFAIIFFRLWFLQVLSGDQYLAKATTNRSRHIPIAAPRGEILDVTGTPMVTSVKALAVQISPPDLPKPVSLTEVSTLEHPPKADAAVYNRLAHVLGMSTKRVSCQLHIQGQNTFPMSRIACLVGRQVSLVPFYDVTVESGTKVSKDIQFYLGERQAEFSGVEVQKVYQTQYPMGTLAAQVLGYVAPISEGELKQRSYKGVPQDSAVGQTGLEAEYDSFLRGTAGYQDVQVNSVGQSTGTLFTHQPSVGHDLRLSLNAAVQRTGEQALQQSMNQNYSPGGAFVAMNPQTGSVYAMGSLPSYNPSVFNNLSESTYKQLTNPNNGNQLLNRADQSAGPTGSTFKPITATAALQSGVWSPDETWDDTGQFCVGTGGAQQCRHNSGHAVDGVLAIPDALKVSSDDFFYNLGALTNADPNLHPGGGPLDQWASRFGIGRRTGIDLPYEVAGTLPTPKWRANRDKLELECETATGPFRWTNGHTTSSHHHKGWSRSPKHASCGIADGRPWSIGDNISLAVGQGDVQVTPLQLAVAYSALANGGTIVRPHLAEDVEDPDGTILQKIDPPAARHLPINPIYLETIRQGLREAASSPGGTSADVFSNFAQQVYGKTGTAQYVTNGVEQDYSWYACFVPATATSKPITVVVTVEKGGFGAVAAAPVAREILSQWFYGKPGPYQAGSSTTL